MNYPKIAAALHALADAVAEGETEAKPAKGKAAKAAAAAVAEIAPVTATVATTAQQPVTPQPPPAPSITKKQLNDLVLKVAAKSRDRAVELLQVFGHSNTINLPEDKWQAVYDVFEEELAKIDAAAVQIAQASLV